MADLLQIGSDWLEAERHEHLTHTVSYHRGVNSVQLQATVGQTMWEVDTAHGVESWEGRDYLIRASDLVIGAVQITPQRGDQIKEVIGADTVVFEVMAPGTEPIWRYSDPGGKTLRVHTKHVDTE